jgi:hypothetical protein
MMERPGRCVVARLHKKICVEGAPGGTQYGRESKNQSKTRKRVATTTTEELIQQCAQGQVHASICSSSNCAEGQCFHENRRIVLDGSRMARSLQERGND